MNPAQTIRYTLAPHPGAQYDLTCQVELIVDNTICQAWVCFRPERGQFQCGAIGVLVADVRTMYLEASVQHALPRLADWIILELADPVSDEDVAWMQHEAWLLGIDLVVRQLPT